MSNGTDDKVPTEEPNGPSGNFGGEVQIELAERPNYPREDQHKNELEKQHQVTQQKLAQSLVQAFIAFMLISLFFLFFIAGYLMHKGALDEVDLAQFKDMVNILLTPFVALVSGVIGYYFGQRQ